MKKLFLLLLLLVVMGALVYWQYPRNSNNPSISPLTGRPLSVYQSVSYDTSCSDSSIHADFQIPVLTLAQIQDMDAAAMIPESRLNPDIIPSLFYSVPIDDDIKERIWNISYPEDAIIPLTDLRYVRVLHRGIDGATYIGELIVNKSIAEDILKIFYELYIQNYPIEKMVLIDTYHGDDIASMEENNTSAFNFRNIGASTTLSNHSYGMAIDINPKYNPYVSGTGDKIYVSPASSKEYADRSLEFPCKIDADDLCVKLFKESGFYWGGDWPAEKDYQHFEKYVSK